jgi:hypothetical protein
MTFPSTSRRFPAKMNNGSRFVSANPEATTYYAVAPRHRSSKHWRSDATALAEGDHVSLLRTAKRTSSRWKSTPRVVEFARQPDHSATQASSRFSEPSTRRGQVGRIGLKREEIEYCCGNQIARVASVHALRIYVVRLPLSVYDQPDHSDHGQSRPRASTRTVCVEADHLASHGERRAPRRMRERSDPARSNPPGGRVVGGQPVR